MSDHPAAKGALSRAAQRWTRVVDQPANQVTGTTNDRLWRLEPGDHGAVWLRQDRHLVWGRYKFPVPMAALTKLVNEDHFSGERLGAAFDCRGMYGPWVDLAIGTREPNVDNWEAGIGRPTLDQMRRAAFLTRFPVGWFFNSQPLPEIGWSTLDLHLPAPPKRRRGPQQPGADFA